MPGSREYEDAGRADEFAPPTRRRHPLFICSCPDHIRRDKDMRCWQALIAPRSHIREEMLSVLLSYTCCILAILGGFSANFVVILGN
jgi:hypothetical protein